MDKSRFTEVKGIEALKILIDGGELTNGGGVVYRLSEELGLHYSHTCDGGWSISSYTLTEVVAERTWYVPKPFDIRDAALEKPNEWVGAYYEQQSRVLYKVGFDKELMQLIEAEYDNPFDCLYRRPGTNTLNPSIKFEDMFPIEQVDRPMTVDKPKEFDTDVPF